MKYVLRKFAFYLVALWIAVTLNFLVPRLVPGDPASSMPGEDIPDQNRDRPRATARPTSCATPGHTCGRFLPQPTT